MVVTKRTARSNTVPVNRRLVPVSVVVRHRCDVMENDISKGLVNHK
jgi:hypothetical protein